MTTCKCGSKNLLEMRDVIACLDCGKKYLYSYRSGDYSEKAYKDMVLKNMRKKERRGVGI